MIFESYLIFAIILVIMLAFLKADKKYAAAVSPLLIPVGMNILAHYFSEYLSKFLPIDYFTFFVIINISAAIVSSLLVGRLSLKFTHRSSRISYSTMCIIFNISIASIFVYNLYEKLYL